MKKKDPMEAKDIAESFFKDVLANFFVIIMAGMVLLWMMMA